MQLSKTKTSSKLLFDSNLVKACQKMVEIVKTLFFYTSFIRNDLRDREMTQSNHLRLLVKNKFNFLLSMFPDVPSPLL